MKHSYLYKHIEKPVLDQSKLILLTDIIDHTTLTSSQKESYIITTMLVQVALDTHEKVPVTRNVDENRDSKVAGQLKVLAGDYYSGLYYLLLSEIKEIELIHKLANAIKEINENKMRLYYNEAATFVEYLDILANIESLLISSVADFVNDTTYKSICKEWVLTNRLIQEKQNYMEFGMSPLLDAGKYFTDKTTSENELSMVNDIIEKNLNKLSLFMGNDIHRETMLGHAIQHTLKEYSTISEEG